MTPTRFAVVLILLAVLFTAVCYAATEADVGWDAIGGSPSEKDLLIIAIPALTFILKKTLVPTDQDGKVVKKWKPLVATLPVVLSIAYAWYRGGGIGIGSTMGGVILGATVLGGRNWFNKLRGK